ncbi:hypothetical protein SKAU_G00334900 [Synaphobranchus kaupii]|uniref:Uncharacterized protein n=1 Tax=Synaphobranchus kaupii TaxID=118154 RepID=A0A9Q1ELX9_SYNKA|nr:hypothetical protein SKAU_G00334900 [Synaphobranchus kaupii]
MPAEPQEFMLPKPHPKLTASVRERGAEEQGLSRGGDQTEAAATERATAGAGIFPWTRSACCAPDRPPPPEDTEPTRSDREGHCRRRGNCRATLAREA